VAESKIKPDKTKNLSHLDIAAQHDMLDFANASKLTGSKFVFMKNEIALLELALINWTMNLLASKGYTPLLTPDIARAQVVEACGFQPRDASSQVYHLERNNTPLDQQECLIGTSEIPLAGMFANELLNKESLPGKFVAFSHCFRKEAGHGQHSKGLYRLH
jgi:seryl-tRNA synthetase